LKIGTNLVDESDFELDLKIYKKTHTFIQAMTGGGKTSLILKLEQESRKADPDMQTVYLDDQEEFTDIPKMFSNFRLISKDTMPKIFTVNHAKGLGIQVRRLGLSVVVDLHQFKVKADRTAFVAGFLEGFMSVGKEVGTPAKIIIDEADQYCPRIDKKITTESKEQIIDVAKRGRKYNITIVIATQYLSEVDISARRECANRIVGKATEPSDRRVVKGLMGLTQKQADELFDFTAGNFYVRGEMFVKGVSRIFVPESEITRKQAGVVPTATVKSLDDILERAVENKTDQTLVEVLQLKIGDLEKQLAQEKIKSSQQYAEGFLASENNWKDKSKVEKFLS